MGIRFYPPIRAYWRFVWVVASPIISLVSLYTICVFYKLFLSENYQVLLSCVQAVFLFVMSQYVPAGYGSYKFPAWADVIGWLISISTLLPFPIFAVYRIIYGKEVRFSFSLPQPSRRLESPKTLPRAQAVPPTALRNGAYPLFAPYGGRVGSPVTQRCRRDCLAATRRRPPRRTTLHSGCG